jgi:hypothetical protein
MQSLRIFPIALLLVWLTGCATMIRGTEQQVSINTSPVGAHVQFSNGVSCVSPCSITAKRNQPLTVTITKNYCQTQTASMVPTLAGGGVILGGLIDYGTGAVYDLQPNPLTVTLACAAEGLGTTTQTMIPPAPTEPPPTQGAPARQVPVQASGASPAATNSSGCVWIAAELRYDC